jgi:hypothetical protein
VQLCFVLAIADKKPLVLDVERHVDEAQELVSVYVIYRSFEHILQFSP